MSGKDLSAESGSSVSASAALHQQFPPGSRSNAALSAFGLDDAGPARRSQRAIKRKKFDDEIVDTASQFSAPSTPATAPANLGGVQQTAFPLPSAGTPTAGFFSPSSAAALALRTVGKGGGVGKNLRTRTASLNICAYLFKGCVELLRNFYVFIYYSRSGKKKVEIGIIKEEKAKERCGIQRFRTLETSRRFGFDNSSFTGTTRVDSRSLYIAISATLQNLQFRGKNFF